MLHRVVVWPLLALILVPAAHAAAGGTPAGWEAGADLRAFARRVVEENPRVRAAAAALEQARNEARAAGRPLYNPELEVDYEDASSTSGSVGINQAIDWGDKRTARSEVADHRVVERAAELRRIRQELLAELLGGIADYQSAGMLHRLARQRSELMERFESLARKRREAGDLNQVELDLARLAAAQARLQLASAATDLAAARQTLLAIVGERPREWPELPDETPSPRVGEAEIEQLVARLPQVGVLKARLAAARGMVELRRRERVPDPVIGVRGGREESDLLVGLNLSIPLFVRNDFRAEVAVADQAALVAEQEGMDLVRRARARLAGALERYRLAREAWETWQRQGMESVRSQTAVVDRLWRAGELSTADYLVQLRQIIDTRASAAGLWRRLWRSWIEWLVAGGRVGLWLGLDRAVEQAK